jgi:endo-beta-N-acetylglucosaminidase D
MENPNIKDDQSEETTDFDSEIFELWGFKDTLIAIYETQAITDLIRF